jgi:hypothetical protein
LIAVAHSYLDEMFHAVREALLSRDTAGPLCIMERVRDALMEENYLIEERFKMDDDALATLLAVSIKQIDSVYEQLFREQATDDPAERDEWVAAMEWLREDHQMVPLYAAEEVMPFTPEEKADLFDTFVGEHQAPHA